MFWIIVEVILALAAVLFVVWWTMFSGDRGPSRHHGDDAGS